MKTTNPSRSKLPLAAVITGLVLFATQTHAADNTGTGGTITYTDINGLNPVASPPYTGGYVVHKFTSSDTLNIPVPATAQVLVVAGGGGGGKFGGGGGAGGLIYNTSVPVAAGNTTVTVGAGGAGDSTTTGTGTNGSNSVFSTLTAIGGGGGGSRGASIGTDGAAGGSGGGASASDSTTVVTAGGAATALQGNAGGSGRSPAASLNWGSGGGGGASAAGSNATGNSTTSSGGKGGDGLDNSITGSSVFYAGGGGGGTYSAAGSGTAGAGGNGGGGAGAKPDATNGTAGTANTGGGGGGGGVSATGGAGGSGIVIVRYPYDSGGPDTTPPTVVTLSPADNATNVTTTANLVVTFNEAITIGTGNITLKNLTDTTETTIDITSGSPQVSVAGTVLTINPTADLAAGKNYAIQIAPTAIKDAADNFFAGIADNITWDFSTDGTSPTVVTLSPADNATNVTTTANLVVTFNEAITIGTGNITLKNLTDATDTTIDITSGSPQVSVAGTVLTINPTADLVAGKNYAIQIAATAIKDTSGNFFAGIADNTTWNFTTDGTPPTVVTLSPADNATFVTTTANLVVTFSEAITIGTGNITLRNLTDATDTTLDITSGSPQVSVAGAVLTINPTADLTVGKVYAIQIAPTAIKDASGNPFAGIADNTTWNFSVNISQVSSSTELAYAADVSNSDLLNGLTATTTGWNLGNGSTTPELNDGIHGRTFTAAGNSVEGTWTTNGATAIYNLGTSTQGYNLTSIQTIAAWNGAGFGNQAYTVDIKLKGAGSYVTLASVNYQPLGTGGTTPGASKITMIDPSGVLATGVEFIRFTANNVNGGANGGAFVFREIDVFGAPSNNNTFANWISTPAFGIAPGQQGLNQDPDGDGIKNGVENFFGSDPGEFSPGHVAGGKTANTFTFTHPQGSTLASDLTASYRWSTDLATFLADGASNGGTTVNFTVQPNTPAPGTTTVTATVVGTALDKLFVTVGVTQN